ncbi:MAG: hypothetical protein ACYDEU_04460, partial [Vulcanimicrobiaceae bacterium]
MGAIIAGARPVQLVRAWMKKRSMGFFAGQFFAAGFLQGRKIVLRQLPHDGCGDAFVVVAQHVADACHFLPTPRSTSHCRCRSVSNTSRGISSS